jgi:DEAD/DEAH box helicase domain-containing protein
VSVNICDDKTLKDLYHEIIKYEVKLLSGSGSSNIPCYVSSDKLLYEDYCVFRQIDYGLSIDELKSIAKSIGATDICLEELIRRGFLIPLALSEKELRYRTFHIDTLLRASDIRIKPGGGKMVLHSGFIIGEHYIDDFSQALLLPRRDGIDEERELHEFLIRNLGEIFAIIYIKALQEYLNARGAKGLTYFQLKALKQIIASFRDKNVYVITAPAGSGKTEIFLFITLYKLLLDLKNKRRSRVLIVYPRKFLEIDQSERVIKLVKILNERLKQYSLNVSFSVALRDGDTSLIEDEVKRVVESGVEAKDIEFRGIKCGQNGTLVIQVHRNRGEASVACKEGSNYDTSYSFVKWSRKDSKEADIVITNLHTLFFRVIARQDEDLDIRDIVSNKPVDMIILDEVHEYEPAELGLLYYTFKTLNYIRSMNRLDPLKVILSSATIANAGELAEKLTDEAPLLLNYSDIVVEDRNKIETLERSGKIGLTKKLVILGFMVINPTYSWETYLSQLVAALLYMNKVLDSLGMPVKQTIIFLNNVRELNRVHAIIENDLQLGSPLDNAGLKGSWGKILDPARSRFSLRHYTDLLKTALNNSKDASELLKYSQEKGQLKEHLFPRLAKVFSGTPLDERLKIAKGIYEKDIYTVIATSSLELGVDYPGVAIVVNVGFTDKLPSIIQRFGRAGRRLSDTLNTTLALLIVRNNPLEYVRLFEALKDRTLTLMVKGFLTPDVIKVLDKEAISEISVKVAREIEAIKKLGALRGLLTMTALNGKLHGLEKIENEQKECETLVNLREHAREYDELLVKLLGDAENATKTLGFKNVEECKEYYWLLRQLDICISLLEERIKSLSEIVDIFTPMIQKTSMKMRDVDIEKICKWLKDLHELRRKYDEALLEIQRDNLFDILMSREEFGGSIKSFIGKIINLEDKLKKLYDEIYNNLPSVLSGLFNRKLIEPEEWYHINTRFNSIYEKIKRESSPCRVVTS